MQKGRRHCGMGIVLVLFGLLAGCQGGGSDERSEGGTARVHIQVGHDPVAQHGTTTRSSGLTAQRVDGIPKDVTRITLSVTTNGQDIPGSPLRISLETGTVSLDIQANVAHRFIIEASNQYGIVIFRGEVTKSFSPGADENLSITLVERTFAFILGGSHIGDVSQRLTHPAN